MSSLLVTQYQAEVEKIIRYGGSKKETSIRNAFERLLNDYCKPRNYLLVPELDFKTKFNTTVFLMARLKMLLIAYSTFLSIMNVQRCETFGRRLPNLEKIFPAFSIS